MESKLRNFLFDKKHEFVFSYVPKVACSNWKCVMRYLAGYENYLDTKYAHDRKINGLSYLVDETDPRAILSDPSIKNLTCVRNPYSRALSAYINKIEFNINKLNCDIDTQDIFLFATSNIEAFRKEKLDNNAYPSISFEVFLKWLLEGPSWLTANEHWLPQTDLVQIEYVKYDFIGRFENLRVDAPKILEIMGCDIDFPSQKDINFAPTKATEKIHQYIGYKEAALIQKIYSNDFENFGYSLEVEL